MLTADVLMFTTPVYFYCMSGQMKTMIDRTMPKYAEISDKEVYFIITAANTDKPIMEKVIEALRGFTRDCLESTEEKGIIYGLGSYEPDTLTTTASLQEAYEMDERV